MIKYNGWGEYHIEKEIETLQARIAELEADKLYMQKIQDELVEQRDTLGAALVKCHQAALPEPPEDQ